MTDKRKTLLWIIEDYDSTVLNDSSNSTRELIDQIIEGGNTQMLVMRQKSMEEPHGVFNAVTSLSQIDGRSLDDRI